MRIAFVELANFRKLKAARIDFSEQQTLFVGANNSGKTSAMVALRLFLKERGGFTTRDVTLSNWQKINALGESWLAPPADAQRPNGFALTSLLPALDIWFDVDDQELHRVSHILPTLDWTDGKVGVRLRLEPRDIDVLAADYRTLRQKAAANLASYKAKHKEAARGFDLWPISLHDYLDRRFTSALTLKAYILDPRAIVSPGVNHESSPQVLPLTAEPLDGDPLAQLIHIREISAQRGFSDASPSARSEDDDSLIKSAAGKRRLSEQLQAYYKRHLDPDNDPSEEDVAALGAFHQAQKTFDERLAAGFSEAIKELEQLGYPGLTNPSLTIATRIRPTDGLNHPSAVQYNLTDTDGEDNPLRLPEDYNGLGFQNLISMVFLLIRFRADWMRFGKMAPSTSPSEESAIEPLQLVLIEEPEAHLHAQVQQVFIRKAYEVLRNHKDLEGSTVFQTQLVVSTHSSHVAHEVEFSSLRYFKRLPPKDKTAVPNSVVANLSEVFGKGSDTARFVSRYLRTTHCDLFFADAAILIEGAAERMLLPHFIRRRYSILSEHYISTLEIGGSHAHRLKPLIELLGIPTLVITDLDAIHNGLATRPQLGADLNSANPVLKSWLPAKEKIDELMAGNVSRTKIGDGHGVVHVTYQQPLKIKLPAQEKPETVIPSTFEDALVLANLTTMMKVSGVAMTNAIAKIVSDAKTPTDLCEKLFQRLRSGADKAGFALDLLDLPSPDPIGGGQRTSDRTNGPAPLESLIPPQYVADGLGWLEGQVKANRETLLPDGLQSEFQESQR